MNPMGYLPGFGGLLLLGLAFFLHRRAAARRRRAARWATTEGEVLESRVEEKEGHSDGARYKHYVPVIRYAYAVGGRSYEGNRVHFSSGFGQLGKSQAEALIAPYPAGSRPRVSYDPDSPAECVLEPGTADGQWKAIALFGLIFLGVGIYVLLGGE